METDGGICGASPRRYSGVMCGSQHSNAEFSNSQGTKVPISASRTDWEVSPYQQRVRIKAIDDSSQQISALGLTDVALKLFVDQASGQVAQHVSSRRCPSRTSRARCRGVEVVQILMADRLGNLSALDLNLTPCDSPGNMGLAGLETMCRSRVFLSSNRTLPGKSGAC